MNRFPVENIDKVNSAKSADTASNSTTAEKLLTARDIVITGDLSGSASFNGASNVSISTTIKDDSHNHVINNIDNLQNTLNTMNTTISGKAASSHNHTLSQITDYSAPTLVNRSNYADKLTTARNITLSGDVTGTISFNGSGNVTIPATIANSGVTAGTYGPSANATLTHGGKVNIPCVTVSAKGQVTAAYNRVMTLPTVTASSIGAATFGLEKLAYSKIVNATISSATKTSVNYYTFTMPVNGVIFDIYIWGNNISAGREKARRNSFLYINSVQEGRNQSWYWSSGTEAFNTEHSLRFTRYQFMAKGSIIVANSSHANTPINTFNVKYYNLD